MAISFKCGGCAKEYTVKDALAGKRAQCKQCGQIMTIPALAAAHEPDLRADTRDPQAPTSAETVAGTLIPGPLETIAGRGSSVSGKSVAGQSVAGKSVAGKSVSGQSVSGKSMSGRSMSGRSAAGMSASGLSASGSRPAPAPVPTSPADEIEFNNNFRPEPVLPKSDPNYGKPQLSPLPRVDASDLEALAVHGGTDQPLRQGRGPAAKNRVPMEPWSFLLALVMLGVLGYAVYAAASAPVTAKPYAADVLADAGKPWMVAAARYGVYAAMTLALLAPLVAGAWVAALKIMNVRLPDGLYMRSLGIAAVATSLTALTTAGPVASLNGIGLVAALVSIAACYALLQFVQTQKPTVAGIATGIAAALGAIGVTVMQSAADAAAAPMQTKYESQLAKVDEQHKEKKIADDTKAKAVHDAQVAAATPAADLAAADAAVKVLQPKVDAFKAGLSDKRQTREKAAAAADVLAAAVDAAKKKYPDRAELATMATDLAGVRPQIEALPTATPPADLAEAPPAGADWSARGGRKEVSAFGFNFTPPPDATLDLDSRDAPGGAMTWLIPDGRTKLTIEQTTAPSPKQQRPWVAPAFVVDAATDSAFAIPADNAAPTEFGTINGLPAAKVTLADPAAPGVVYALHKGATWLKCTITGVGETGPAAAQQAVRSLRERAAGEPAIDPLPAADLIARYQAEPAQADRLLAMIKTKPNAEEAVVKALGFAPDDATLDRFAPLLIATGGEKSSHILWKIAGGSTPNANAARDKLRTLESKTADDIAFAVVDLKSGNFSQIGKGLSVLASADVDKARLPTVSKTLGTGIEDQSLVRGGNVKTLETALEKWMDPDLAKKVLKLLDADTGTVTGRRLAMRVLGATGDKKYVQPIFNCVKTDPDAVAETLIAMGPAAEPDMARMLTFTETMRTPVALKAALAILNEIGTQRSLSALATLAAKTGDPEAKETAKTLIAKIKENSKSAPPPAK